ncbi:hypothetical protein SD81_009225 [Tolypothrix campylonemoides VB511288]|nr:hypothetical protein SD81_009225 [Tolypothrix campylonemoides VB511288]
MVVKKFALDLYGRRSLLLLPGFMIAVSNTGKVRTIVSKTSSVGWQIHSNPEVERDANGRKATMPLAFSVEQLVRLLSVTTSM